MLSETYFVLKAKHRKGWLSYVHGYPYETAVPTKAQKFANIEIAQRVLDGRDGMRKVYKIVVRPSRKMIDD